MDYPWLEEARREFTRRLTGGRMAHACLIAGPVGLGKLQLGREMASTLLCRAQGPKACGTCRSCELLSGGAHPDFRWLTFEVNPKSGNLRSELVIEQVRDLNASMQLTNSISPRKVALICPAEAMNRNTANALLKTLEEPAGDAVLLLVSHEPSRLAPTIRSRCQMISVRLPDDQAATDWLVNVHGMPPDLATVALRASAGSPLRALQFVQDGELDRFQEIEKILAAVFAGRAAVAEVMDTCSSLDQDRVWIWLSLAAAEKFRSGFDGTGARGGLACDADGAGLLRSISLLQSQADKNRRILATTVRKDLLLRDWLIQWSRLREP